MIEFDVALWDTSCAPAVSSRTSSSLAVTGVPPGRLMHWVMRGPGCDRRGGTSPISRGTNWGGHSLNDRSL